MWMSLAGSNPHVGVPLVAIPHRAIAFAALTPSTPSGVYVNLCPRGRRIVRQLAFALWWWLCVWQLVTLETLYFKDQGGTRSNPGAAGANSRCPPLLTTDRVCRTDDVAVLCSV